MINNLITKLTQGINLDCEESYLLAQHVLNSRDTATIINILKSLSSKGEVASELVGFVRAIEESSIPLKTNRPTIDIVGTGGDLAHTLNISTAAALLTAACGVPVVKHGNRAVSSYCGAADVLEFLGFDLNLDPNLALDMLTKTNFTFCYAPKYHPVLAKVRAIREQIGAPTIFNLLGPLLNPAGRAHLVFGVYDKDKVPLLAEALLLLGTTKSAVFSGCGIDELSNLGATVVTIVTADGLSSLEIDPVKLGFKLTTLDKLAGLDVNYNASVVYDTLCGIQTHLSDSIVLNAALALLLYGRVTKLEDGVALACERLHKGDILKESMLQQIVMRKYKALNITKKKSLKHAILQKPGFGIIAEIKRASPSRGIINQDLDPKERALQYVTNGAAAISVLTDEGFMGTTADLQLVVEALRKTPVPILRKDFIIHPKQISESYDLGADAILLMVSVLHNNTAQMVRLAHQFGMEALIEVHSLAELEIALASKADVIGVNQRDLRDFSIHPEIFTKVINAIPRNVVKIAESGFKTIGDIREVIALGYNGVLVGEALSMLDDTRELLKVGGD